MVDFNSSRARSGQTKRRGADRGTQGLSIKETANYLDTLACALALNARISEAIKIEEQAITGSSSPRDARSSRRPDNGNG
jgi:hypothetical protein